MAWRQVETTEERPFGMWSRAELDAMAEAERKAGVTARRIGRSVDRERARRKDPMPRPPRRTGSYSCPECPAMFSSPSAVGSHRAYLHGYRSPRRRSLPAA